MKHFWRIAITIVVLVAVGFTCYFLFFKKDSDLDTFTKLSDTIDKRDSLGIDTRLNELQSYDGHGTKYSKNLKVKKVESETKLGFKVEKTTNEGAVVEYYEIINSMDGAKSYFVFADDKDSYADIINYRKMLFTTTSNEKYFLNINDEVYSYVKIESELDEIFDYYFAYAQLLKEVKNSDQKVMNKYIKSYNSALTDFNDQLKSVISYQGTYTLNLEGGNDKSFYEVGNLIENSTTEYSAIEYKKYDKNSNLSGKIELTNRYLELIKQYRNLLSKKCDLIEQLKSMVIKYVFDGEFIIEADTVNMDLLLMMSKIAFSKEYDLTTETSSLKNIAQFVDTKENGYYANKLSSDMVLDKYNKIVEYSKTDLNKVLALTNAQLNFLANNNQAVSDIKSTLNQDYVDDLIYILKAFGFGGEA